MSLWQKVRNDHETRVAELRRNTLAAAAAIKHVTTKSIDMDFEDNSVKCARAALRVHPLMAEVLEVWWETAIRSSCSEEGAGHPADLDHARLGEAGYIEMVRKICKAMICEYDEAEATAIAQEDWLADAKGGDSIGREELFDALFELTDLWTNSVEAEDYVTFLWGVFGCITKGGTELR